MMTRTFRTKFALVFAFLLAGVTPLTTAYSDDTVEGAPPAGESQAFARWHAYPQETHTTESGLQYKILELGDGPRPKDRGSKVTVLYRGFLEDGQQFETTYEWGVPLEIKLRKTIEGWEEGVQLMPTGSRFAFLIPPELAYGERGPSRIPDNATLLFEIELLEVDN